MPKVSVILTTFNGAKRGFLSFAIESVLSQTFKDFELLIIDDGSSDNTKQICDSYLTDSSVFAKQPSLFELHQPLATPDKRVQYIYQNNRGVSAARNNGIAKSHGTYICFLDDDDVWLPKKLEKQINLIESFKDKTFGLCYSALEIIDSRGNRTGVIQSHKAHGSVFKKMLYENLVDCTSSVMIPKQVFKSIGGFEDGLSYAEDYDLWLRIAKNYNIYSIDEPLVLYREHENKLSKNIKMMEKNTLLVVKRYWGGIIEKEQATILCKIYDRFARYRFWIKDYRAFRSHVKQLARYGCLSTGLAFRFIISYMPWLIELVKVLKR